MNNLHIPFVDLNRIPKKLSREIDTEVKKVLSDKDFILGKKVEEFEKAFVSYLGVKYCIGVASGTDALMLSQIALGIGPGDEVIVPAMTFFASVAPTLYLHAKPVLVDVDSDLPLIDPSKIEKALSKKTKAIIVVHLHGFPADMEKIMAISRKYKIPIIEDACQAHGSIIKLKHKSDEWKKAGSIGDIGCFSFYPAKNLGGVGDGGVIATNNADLAQKIRMLRNYGQKQKYHHDIVGYNSRLDTIQATVLLAKLPYLDQWNKSRRESANFYNKLLLQPEITYSKERMEHQGNYHIYGIRTKKRDGLLAFLKSRKIDCGIHYPYPLHMLPALKDLKYKKGDFTNAERFAEETVSLPMFQNMKRKELIYIKNMIEEFFQ